MEVTIPRHGSITNTLGTETFIKYKVHFVPHPTDSEFPTPPQGLDKCGIVIRTLYNPSLMFLYTALLRLEEPAE